MHIRTYPRLANHAVTIVTILNIFNIHLVPLVASVNCMYFGILFWNIFGTHFSFKFHSDVFLKYGNILKYRITRSVKFRENNLQINGVIITELRPELGSVRKLLTEETLWDYFIFTFFYFHLILLSFTFFSKNSYEILLFHFLFKEFIWNIIILLSSQRIHMKYYQLLSGIVNDIGKAHFYMQTKNSFFRLRSYHDRAKLITSRKTSEPGSNNLVIISDIYDAKQQLVCRTKFILYIDVGQYKF